MGLSHHWQRSSELPAVAFAAAVKDCEKVLAQIGVPLAGFEGAGKPVFQPDAMMFNGAAGRCEPFEIHQTEFDRRGQKVFWSHCKTEHAPYDICVKAALVVLKQHMGDAITVASDAGDDDWQNARKACQDCLGYGESFRLSKE